MSIIGFVLSFFSLLFAMEITTRAMIQHKKFMRKMKSNEQI